LFHRICATVNTRQLKKARAKHRSYINNNPENTLVEHNGSLRPANMLDMKALPWRATRNNMEHTYADAKKGWLDRVNRNMTKSWGRAPPRAPRLRPPPPPPPPPAVAASEFGTPVADASNAVAESKSSQEVTSDVSASKAAETNAASPVAEPILETSSVPAVDSSVDSTVPTSDSELIADMTAVETSLEVSPPLMEADPVEERIVSADATVETVDVAAAPVELPVVTSDVSAETVNVVASLEEPVVAADLSAKTVDVMASPVVEQIVAAEVTVDVMEAPADEPTVNTDAAAVAVAAPQRDFTSTENESKRGGVEAEEELTLSAAPSTDQLFDDTSTKTDAVAGEELNAVGGSQAMNDTTSPTNSNPEMEANASDISHESIDDPSPKSDNSLVDEMNASEASLIAASLDHQIDSTGDGQSSVSPKSTKAALSSASSEDSTVEVASVEPTVVSDAGFTHEALTEEATADNVKSVESEDFKVADLAVESSTNEVNGAVDGDSVTAAMPGDTGHPAASSIEPEASVDDVIVEDVSNVPDSVASSPETIEHSEEDKSQLSDGDPQKDGGPHDKH
jgi:hypothetical protein